MVPCDHLLPVKHLDCGKEKKNRKIHSPDQSVSKYIIKASILSFSINNYVLRTNHN